MVSCRCRRRDISHVRSQTHVKICLRRSLLFSQWLVGGPCSPSLRRFSRPFHGRRNCADRSNRVVNNYERQASRWEIWFVRATPACHPDRQATDTSRLLLEFPIYLRCMCASGTKSRTSTPNERASKLVIIGPLSAVIPFQNCGWFSVGNFCIRRPRWGDSFRILLRSLTSEN